MRCAGRHADAEDGRVAASTGRRPRLRRQRQRSTCSVTAAIEELRSALPATEFRDALLDRLVLGLYAGPRHGRRVRAVARAGARRPEASWSTTARIPRPSRCPPASSRASWRPRARRPGWPRKPVTALEGARLPCAGRGRARSRSRSSTSIPTRARAGRPPRRRAASSWTTCRSTPRSSRARPASIPRASARTCCSAPSCRTRSSRPICYVAGPNELAYLGQLKDVYAHFGVPMPLMFPRASATILDSAALRFISKYGVALETLQPQDEAGAERAAGEPDSAGRRRHVRGGWPRHRDRDDARDRGGAGDRSDAPGRRPIDARPDAARPPDASRQDDSGGEATRRDAPPPVSSARARWRFRAATRRNARSGFVSFLNQYGPALVDRLDAQLPLDLGHHWLISI